MTERLLDAAGRRPSPATMREFQAVFAALGWRTTQRAAAFLEVSVERARASALDIAEGCG
jgi:hypothetical protein